MKRQIPVVCVLIIFALTGCDTIQAPSESLIREACPTGNLNVTKIELGKSMTSQGGIMDRGAPKGTTMYPVKFMVTLSDGTPHEMIRWLFKDSFDKWTCTNMS